MAKKKNEPVVSEPEIVENISVETLEDVMSSRFATYAKYVIQDRAIPDVRDGLKPVQRRIIYTMYKTGNVFNKPTKKCAHTVGAVMGTFHPHGDTSIYEALARMSQDWKIRIPLIDFQGNNGSIDGDNPAAYRYTESRLAKISNELIRDIEKDTVDMQLNFDDTEFEPTVLPCRFPNLFLNGTEGIAVGLATEIPPHNLCEIIDAVIYRINHKNVISEDLMQFVKGPDFPGGGIVYASEGLKNIYTTGNGRIEIAAKAEIVEGKTINQIIISEIPYGMIKKDLVYQIDLIRSKKDVGGILEVRDESAMDEIRIVIDIRKDAKADLILKYLMEKKVLKIGYSANMVAIDKGKPQTITLLSYVDAYIDHQRDVVTRKCRFDLDKANQRLEIVEGLIIATENINEVVEIIRKSKDKEDSKLRLMDRFNLSKNQSEAIVMMPLYKLSNTDTQILLNEKTELVNLIAELKAILEDENKLDRVIVKDLKFIKDTYGDARRTQIVEKEDFKPLNKRDLITNEDTMIAITFDGYLKRSTVKSYRSSGDNPLPGIKDGDILVARGQVATKDYVICFTNKGNYISLPVHEIVENKWKEEGVHMNTYSSLAPGEKIIKVFNVRNVRNDLFLVFLTKFGQIKRMSTQCVEVERGTRPVKCMKLLTNDELVGVELCSGNSDLLVIANNGIASQYNENDLSIIGLKTAGVKSINGLAKAYACGLISFEPEEKSKVVLITDNGHARVIDNNRVPRMNRLSKTTIVMPIFKSSPHTIVSAIKIPHGIDVMNLNLRFKGNDSSVYTLDDFHLEDINKYAKKNMDVPSKQIMSASYSDIVTIDNKTVSYPVEVKQEIVEETVAQESGVEEEETHLEVRSKPQDNDGKDTRFEQISIFDDFDDKQ